MEQIKTLAPILICSMKIFIQIISQGLYFLFDICDPYINLRGNFSQICNKKYFLFIVGAKGGEEAAENRNYLAGRMIEEVTETIRVLQVICF